MVKAEGEEGTIYPSLNGLLPETSSCSLLLEEEELEDRFWSGTSRKVDDKVKLKETTIELKKGAFIKELETCVQAFLPSLFLHWSTGAQKDVVWGISLTSFLF